MGSYAHLYVGELMFHWAKGVAQPYAVHLFRTGEKHVVVDACVPLPKALIHLYGDEPFEASEDHPAVYYQTTTRVLRERLDFMGYTMDTVREYFTFAREQEELSIGPGRYGDPPWMNPDAWMDGIREINEMQRARRKKLKSAPDGSSPLVEFMIKHSDMVYGLPGGDLYAALRLAAEALSDEPVVYDLTDLAGGGYVHPDQDLVELGIEEALSDHAHVARIVVLTEGSSDSRAIGGAMRLLHPHLADYFSFMDFGELNITGGAGELVKLVKAFSAAGIANRIIALFDNDTGAAEARLSLQECRLPDRIAVRSLPEVELLRKYPTEGPSGSMVEDVNGRAGSLEMYFGADVLAGATGAFAPVRWTGFSKRVGTWQGEIDDKRDLGERFSKKLSRALAAGVVPTESDPAWQQMRSVCAVLLTAFREADAQSIIENARGA